VRALWQSETGHLACSWSEVGQFALYNPPWFREASNMQSGFLPPIPDFASHSPFAGATWFQPRTGDRDSESLLL